jgi:hypothetical protein
MEKQYQIFLSIWNKYYHLFQNEFELDMGHQIIQKIKQNNYHFVEEKCYFHEMVSLFSIIIYGYKYNNDEYFEKYDKENPYLADIELNCCYRLKKYLQK